MARTAPVPNIPAIPGMNPGLFVLGGGGDGGGSGAGGGKGAKNKQGANGKNGGNDAEGGGNCGGGTGANCPVHQANPSAGDPVELATGRVFTVPKRDLILGGPFQLELVRQYSSLARDRDVGLGFGWGHSLSYTAHVRRRSIVLVTPEGKTLGFPKPSSAPGDVGMSPDGWAIWAEGGGYTLDANDGVTRHLAPVEGGAPDELFLQSVRDKNGNTIALTYDRGLLVEALDSAQRKIVFRRNPQGRITSVEVKNADVQGRWVPLVSYAYDDLGDLGIVTDADGYATRFTYEDHFLTEMKLPSGLTFHYLYQKDGRCNETWGDYPGAVDPSLPPDIPDTLADGTTKAKGVHHVKIDFGNAGYVEVVDSVQVLRVFMNAAGKAGKTVSGGGVTERVFDQYGYLTSLTDPNGATTTYARDDRGRLLSETDPLGRTRSYVRNDKGLPIEITEPDGSQHKYEYDDRGNMIRRVDPLGRATMWRHDARGLVTEKVFPNGGIARYTWDGQGNLLQETMPNGATRQYAYDAFGRVVAIKNGLGAEVRCAWTDGSRKQAIYDADGGVVRFTYDGANRLTDVVNPNGTVVKYEYGGMDRRVATHLASGRVIRCFYDREGRLLELRNPAGDAYRYRHNLLGRVEGEETFDGRIYRYKRDLMGRVIEIDQAGERTELEYDAAGQLIKRVRPDDSTETFEYDLLGRPISMQSPAGSFTLDRDAAGRVVREVQTVGEETFTLEHAYDVNGLYVRTTSSLGHVEEVERDAFGKRLRDRLEGRHVVTHTLDAMGEEVARAFDEGGRLELSFDLVGRLSHLRVASPHAPAQAARPGEPAWLGQAGGASLERQYQWAPGDDLASVADPLRRTSESFEWDPDHRFVGRRIGNQTADATRYDDAYNHAEVKGRRVYEKANRLIEKDSTRYTWDDLGRLIEKHVVAADGTIGVWKYEWNAAGLLQSVTRPDHTRVELAYDPIGRRLWKREIRAVPGEKKQELGFTRFVWDGQQLIHEIRRRAVEAGDPVVEERTYCYTDGALTPFAQRVVEKKDEKLVRSDWHYYVADQAGAPVALVDAAGRVVCEMERGPWGAMRPLPGNTADTPFRLQGQYEDPEIALAYNRWRYYDADAGRFISPDPIGLGGGLLALFEYGKNTITDVDLFGLHTATAELDGDPVTNTQTDSENFNSGGWGKNAKTGDDGNKDKYLQDMKKTETTPGEKFGDLYRESHSEFKIMRELAPPDGKKNDKLKGSTLVIDGQSRSCPNCAAELERFAKENQMEIRYKTDGQEDLHMDFRPGKTQKSNREDYSKETNRQYQEEAAKKAAAKKKK